MMLNKILSFFLVVNIGMFAQPLLTIEDAIKLGLEKNYAVLIIKNQQEIAKLQNNIGNAGMSPTVTINGNINLSNLNSYQEFSSGVIQEKNGAQSNNTGASINAGWLIFDGFKMFAVKKRLNQSEQLSSIVLKQQMENTVYDIITNYYSVVKINALIKAAKQNLNFYDERKKIAKLKYEIGSDSKVEYLLSQSDENKAKSLIIQLELQLLNSKIKLNTLLNNPIDYDFKTTDTIVVNYNPDINDLKKDILKTNTSILVSKQNEFIIEQTIKEAKANNLPFIQLNAAYNFTRSQSQAGFVFLNKQVGFNAGLSAGWLLFNGTKNNKLVKERNLLFLNQKYISEQTQLNVNAQALNSYKIYALNKDIVAIENQNLKDAEEILNVSIQRYKIGKGSLLETIETQKNLEDCQVRYIDALYEMKVAETDLLKINGALIK